MKKLFTFIIIGLCVGTAYGGGETSQAPARKQRLSDGKRIEESINEKLPTAEAYQVFVTTSGQESEIITENLKTSSVTFSDGTVMISTAGFGGGWVGTAESNLNMAGYNILSILNATMTGLTQAQGGIETNSLDTYSGSVIDINDYVGIKTTDSDIYANLNVRDKFRLTDSLVKNVNGTIMWFHHKSGGGSYLDGDIIGQVAESDAYDPFQSSYSIGSAMKFVADGNFGTADSPTKIEFWTQPSGFNANPVKRMTIDRDGQVSLVRDLDARDVEATRNFICADGTIMTSTAPFGGASFAYITEDSFGVQVSSNINVSGKVKINDKWLLKDTGDGELFVGDKGGGNIVLVAPATLDIWSNYGIDGGGSYNHGITLRENDITIDSNFGNDPINIRASHLRPLTSSVVDLGTPGGEFSNLYLDNGVYASSITLSGTGIEFSDGTVMTSTSPFGGGGWVDTAESNLDMAGYDIANADDINVNSLSNSGTPININDYIGIDTTDSDNYANLNVYDKLRITDNQSTSTNGSILWFHHTAGGGTYTDGDIVGQVAETDAYDPFQFSYSGGSAMKFVADGNFGTADSPTKIEFWTQPSGTNVNPVKRMTIDRDGQVSLVRDLDARDVEATRNFICADGTVFNSTSTFAGAKIKDKTGTLQTEAIMRGSENLVAGSTTTVTLSGATSIENIQITPVGNYSSNIFLYEVHTSSFSITNNNVTDTIQTYWEAIIKE